MSSIARVLVIGFILSAAVQAAPAAPVAAGPEPLDLRHELGATSRQVNKLGLATTTSFQMDVALRYNQSVHRNIQLGVLTDLTLISSGGTVVIWNLLVGPTFNFGGADLRDDFFFGLGAGMQLISSAATTNASFLLGFELGKRCSLWQNVSWTPSISFLLPTATGTTPIVSFNVFQMSVLW